MSPRLVTPTKVGVQLWALERVITGLDPVIWRLEEMTGSSPGHDACETLSPE